MKILISLALTLIFLFILTSIIGAQNQQVSAEKIFLKSRQFTPEKKSWIESARFQTAGKLVSDKIHLIVQLDHIPSTEEKKEFEENGIELLDYIPDKAWFASVSSSQSSQLYSKSSVTFFDYIKPEDKIEPSILSYGVGSWSQNEDGTVSLTVLFFSDVTKEESKKTIEEYGTILSEPETGNVWIVRIPETSIKTLAGEDIVKWIENSPAPRRVFNNESRAIIGVSTVQAVPYGLNGTNVVIAEWDGGWVDATHDDLQGRVIVNDSVGSVINHATHVAGTAIGNGTKSNGLQKGMAPNATLISYEWWNDQSEFNTEYNWAVNNYNAVISQNSWGVGADPINNANCVALLGSYDSSNVWIDNATRGSLGRPITIVWAAGNERSTGASYCGSLGFTYNTTPPYGTSKNTITVGAVTKAEAMTSFSSWGPTDDGRIKPDVVAVGQSVNSTIPTDTYTTSDGTSMAAPAVSGAVALLYQDYRNIHQNSNPLPSTIKALLAHTAKDLNNTGPDFTTGYGLVNATAAVDKIREDNTSEVIIENNITANGQNKTYQISVSSQSSLKLTLAWDDYPGDAAVSKQLVNDLDLVVSNSSGSRFYPWTLNVSNLNQNATQGSVDDTNNIEQVYVSSPSSGIWTVVVNGTSVPQLNQSFSLVSSISIIVDITKPIITIESPLNRTYNTQTIHFNVTVDEALSNATVSLDNQANQTLTNDSVTHYYNISFPSVSEGFHNTTFYANDTSGNINSTTVYFTVDVTKPNIQVQRPENITYTTNVSLPINFAINESASISWCGYSLDNGSNATISNCANTTFNVSAEGSHNIKIYANDTAGNMNVSDARFFAIDLPPRVLTDTQLNVTRINRGQPWKAFAKWNEPVNFSYVEYNITSNLLNISTQTIASNWTNHTNTTGNDWTLGVHAVRFYINDSSNSWNYSSQATFELWGWSETNQSIVPSSINEDTSQILLCRVRDANTTSPISSYNITFYGNSTFLGSNLTNSSGWGNITYSWSQPATYQITCNITDMPSSFYNSSVAANVSTLTVNDTTSPQYSNLRNTSAIFNYTFQANTTWTDNVNISAVIIEANFTNTTSINYTVTTRSGNEYYFTIEVGNQTTGKFVAYKWYANDTSNLWNSTSQFNYTVGKAPTQTRLFLNGTENNKNYQKGSIANITATVNITGKNVTIVANFTNVTVSLVNGATPQTNMTNTSNLNISVYNITAYFLGDGNYTASSVQYNMPVLKPDGEGCSAASECFGGYCNSGACASSAPSSSSSSSSSSSGGGSTTSTERKTEVKVSTVQTSITIPSIATGKNETVTINNFSVREVFVEVKSAVTNVKITVEKIETRPTEVTTPTGIVFNYLKVDKQNITDNDINKTKLKFAVEIPWVTSNNINESTIALQRYANSQWNRLSTTKLSETTGEILYQAESPGFSVFAITGDLKSGLTCPACPSPDDWSACINNRQTRANYRCSNETNYQCQTYNETGTCGIEIQKEEKGFSIKWLVIILVLIAAAGAGGLVWKKSRQKWEKLYKKYKF